MGDNEYGYGKFAINLKPTMYPGVVTVFGVNYE